MQKGGLIHSRHDEVKDELIYLMTNAFNDSAVRNEPKIYPKTYKTNEGGRSIFKTKEET